MKKSILLLALILISVSSFATGGGNKHKKQKYSCKKIGVSKIKKTKFKKVKAAPKAKDTYQVIILKNGEVIKESNTVAFSHKL
jgi:uncharacterized protein YdeI (BOF family)